MIDTAFSVLTELVALQDLKASIKGAMRETNMGTFVRTEQSQRLRNDYSQRYAIAWARARAVIAAAPPCTQVSNEWTDCR